MCNIKLQDKEKLVTVRTYIQFAGLILVALVLGILCAMCKVKWQQYHIIQIIPISALLYLFLFYTCTMIIIVKIKISSDEHTKADPAPFIGRTRKGKLTRLGWGKMRASGVTENLPVPVLPSSLCAVCVPSGGLWKTAVSLPSPLCQERCARKPQCQILPVWTTQSISLNN